jgi:hypothetical protein
LTRYNEQRSFDDQRPLEGQRGNIVHTVTIHRFGNTSKPTVLSSRFTISMIHVPVRAAACAAFGP